MIESAEGQEDSGIVRTGEQHAFDPADSGLLVGAVFI